MSVENSEDFSKDDAVCYDDVIFYGPITDREKIVRERFQRRQKEKVKTQFLPTLSYKEAPGSLTVPSEESKNDISDISIYESFSIDESKYESFNDSLDESKFLNPNEVNISKFSTEHITSNRRKFQAKQVLKGSLCDSLEDIHSLVSNVEKLSLSEEIENINIHEKNNIYDDSLRNDICFENKNFISSDQNFDDDSLAILDFEKAFDDSLEEADILSLSHMDNVILRNGENNTEISVENLSKENAVAKNLFETSVEIIYENAGYVDSSEGNADAPKHLSLTADSLSISENISKDSLDGLQTIPKILEHKSYKRNFNREEAGKSGNFLELEHCDNMNDMDSNPISFHSLSDNNDEFVDEQFTDIERDVIESKDSIVIEDSFIKSSDAEASMQGKKAMNANHREKDNLHINDSFSKSDCTKLLSYSVSNANSHGVNNRVEISDENIERVDVYSNDTICIDDSFILPNKNSCIMDEFHLTNAQVSGIQKSNKQYHSPKMKVDNGLDNTICIEDSFILPPDSSPIKNELQMIDSQVSGNEKSIEEIHFKTNSADNSTNAALINNSVQPVLDIKSEKSTPRGKKIKKSINSKFCCQSHVQQEQVNLEIHPNNTICIDDSFDMHFQDTLTKDEISSKNQFSKTLKDYDTCNQKVNDTINDSCTLLLKPFPHLNGEKNHSSNKKREEKRTPKKDSESYIRSPVKHHLKHLENNNEFSNLNDAIYVNSLPVEPLRMKIDKRSPSTNRSSKKSSQGPSQDRNMDSSKFNIQSPLKDELQNLENKSEARVSHLNETILVDNSSTKYMKVKANRKSPSNVSSKFSSPELKENACTPNEIASPHTAMAFDSPLEGISDNAVKDPKIIIDYFKDSLVLPKDLPKDSNLKLQLEVVFDKNQGVNIISVSTVDQYNKKLTPTGVKVDSRGITEGMVNQSPNLIKGTEDGGLMKVNDKICESAVMPDKNICKGYSLDLPEVKSFATGPHPEKYKFASISTNEAQTDSTGHNVQLLEALDLHDTSCSFIDNRFLQSRDSIIPLNLCIRKRSSEVNCQYLAKTESKENIPLFEKELFSLGHSKSKRKISTKSSNRTPKQLSYTVDVKKSANKTNSVTKIPIRKIDNPIITPVHQKVSKDIKPGSCEKIFKNPLIKSVSATDNLTSLKPLETPRKHFCSVRNSISRVPKSAPRSIPKKFQNIESPVAKYIGKSQMFTPLKTTHRFDGNLILGTAVKSGKQILKTPTCKGSPQCSSGKP